MTNPSTRSTAPAATFNFLFQLTGALLSVSDKFMDKLVYSLSASQRDSDGPVCFPDEGAHIWGIISSALPGECAFSSALSGTVTVRVGSLQAGSDEREKRLSVSRRETQKEKALGGNGRPLTTIH